MRLRLLILSILLAPFPAAGDDDAFFRERVAGVFERRCVQCHADGKAKGELSLSSEKSAKAGGESGEVIVPGKPDDSLLVEYISGDEPQMPKEGKPLTKDEIAAIREWIARGANWPAGVTLTDKREVEKSWAFEPIRRPPVPEAKSDWPRTPIDAFILKTLSDKGLSPSREADRRTLLRRVSFDLTGLPPTAEETEAFENDRDPRAYEKAVDRLLASPHYGERWARHWLDVARYGDSHGFDKDKPRPNAWPYRDYVIRAFNEDKPYSRFVREQLAGDYFYPGTRDGIEALGFIAAGPFDFVGQIELREGTLDKKITRNLDRDDMVSATMNVFTSVTAQCARCHDHKFDPIAQKDYYGLQAVFAAVDRADRAYDSDPEVAARRHMLEARRTELLEEAGRAETLPQEFDSIEALTGKINSLRQSIASIEEELAALPQKSLVYAAATEFTGQMSFRPTHGAPRPVFVLARGSEAQPLEKATPGGISCLESLKRHFATIDPANEAARRAALANWIVDLQNPLTWRSIVNRVWQHHFESGIVESANDFGKMGAQPTHPELLDWLAVEFRDGGQSLKSLHRMIVASAVYRQSSAWREDGSAIDASNRYLWRMNRRRLDAECIRDAALCVSGTLNPKMYGPPFRNFGFKDDHSPQYRYREADPNDPDMRRRSIYRFIVRSAPDPFMTALDCADSSLSVAKRTETLTPLQALALLNDKFMLSMSEGFAKRVSQHASSIDKQTHEAFRLALCREPTPEEAAALRAVAAEHGLASACRLLFNCNEFVFVD